jgi:hypothetical protein
MIARRINTLAALCVLVIGRRASLASMRMRRLLLSILFAIAMFGVWKWAHFITDGGIRWELWIPTMLAIFGLAYWFDKRDRLY